MEKHDTILFEVEGAYPLPWDMLRYDNCYPATEHQAGKLHRAEVPGAPARVRVILECRTINGAEPHAERWESFLWKVTRSRVLREELLDEERQERGF